MNSRFLVFLLLGATVILTVEAARRPPIRGDQPSGDEEENCDEDVNDGPQYDSEGRPNRVGAVRPTGRADDDWDGVEEPTDDDYRRYENTNQEGICILESGKCPQGGWREFKRKNATVCLKLMATPNKIDFITAGRLCRKEANGRIMTVDNHEEFEWIHNSELGSNGSYPYVWLSGYRTRRCQMNPLTCVDKQTTFTQVDGTSDHSYIYSRWIAAGLAFRYSAGYLDDCIVLYSGQHPTLDHALIQDWSCGGNLFNVFLCGITVM